MTDSRSWPTTPGFMALLTSRLSAAERLLDAVIRDTKVVDLFINVAKTEYIRSHRDSNPMS